MKNKPLNRRITEAEWEVMAVIWENTPAAASDVADKLRKRRQWTLATVRTLLRRLVRKGALAQEPDGKRYLYRARISMEEGVRQESESFLARALGRAPLPGLLHLVRRADLTKEDIQELRRILREKEK